MKRIKTLKAATTLCIKHCALIMALCITSCSTDDLATGEPNTGAALTLTVTDNGFANSDGTRAEENGYTTTFTSGDQIGVFAVRNGAIDSRANNVKMTLGDGSWTGTLYDIPGATYYAYYPYQETLTGDLVASASDVDGFFTNVISSWTPATDQNSYDSYTKSDLMVASGTVSNGSLTFDMAHKMGLVVICFYKIDDNTTVISNMPTKVVWSSPTGFAPYTVDTNEGIYRYITNSAQTISGTYDDGKYLFSFTPSLDRGKYKTYTIKANDSYTENVINLSSETTP